MRTSVMIPILALMLSGMMSPFPAQAQATGSTAKIPAFDPASLGVPVHPGARQDAEATRTLREVMEAEGAAYRSDGSVRSVAEFYEKQPGFKVIHEDEKGAILRRCEEEYNEFLGRTITTGCDVEINIQNPWLDAATRTVMKDTLTAIVRLVE